MSEGLREFMDAGLVVILVFGCWLAIGLLGHGWGNSCIRFGIFWIRHGHATQRRHAVQAQALEKMLLTLGQVPAKIKRSKVEAGALVPMVRREKAE
jgi:hypothetical protein